MYFGALGLATNKAKEFSLSFDELQALARRHQERDRKNLMLGLTERFLSDADTYAAKYGTEFGEIICLLLDEVPTETRALLSGLVAPLEQFPDTVVTQLASDEDSVATPVLEHSPVLSDVDLAEIATTVDIAKLTAIARRKKLGVRLTDVLVKRDESEVTKEVVANLGAKFSKPTYRLVAEKAKTDTSLQETLVERPDLEPTLAIQLHPFMSKELKDKLNANQQQEAGSLLDSLEEVVTAPKPPPAAKGPDIANIQIAIQKVEAGELDASEMAISLAEESALSSLCVFIGGVARLTEKSIKAAILNKDPKPISMICGGIGLSSDAFAAIVDVRAEQITLSASESKLEIKDYKNIDEKEAKKVLRVLQKKKATEPIFNPAV